MRVFSQGSGLYVRSIVWPVLLAWLLAVLLGFPDASGESDLTQSRRLLARGQAAAAGTGFARAARGLDPARESVDWADAMAGRAQVCMALGDSCSAVDLLNQALADLPRSAPILARFRLQTGLGIALARAGRSADSATAFVEARATADASGELSARAEVALEAASASALTLLRSDLESGYSGISRGGSSRSLVPDDPAEIPRPPAAGAVRDIEAGIALAAEARRADFELTGRLRLAQVQKGLGDRRGLMATLARVRENMNADSRLAQPRDWLALGMLLLGTPDGSLAPADLAKAREQAGAIEDWVTASLAAGSLGRWHEGRREWDVALGATGEALFLAQRAANPRALFEWQWQSARLLLALGRRTEAKEFYLLAATTFRRMRGSLGRGTGAWLEIESHPGEAFLQLANLNLALADDAPPGEERKGLLFEARDAVEAYKSFQVESQFLSADCSMLLENLSGNLEQALEVGGKDTAIIYVLPLETRTELLVTLPGRRLERRTVAKGRAILESHAVLLREALRSSALARAGAIRANAEVLYASLVRPIEDPLTNAGIRTLVFVTDGALARIPMAILSDGNRYLIEQFAVAHSPGLALLEVSRPRNRNPRILLGALTTTEPNYDRLVHTHTEVQIIKKHFRGTLLEGTQFNATNLSRALSQEAFSIVHLACHAQFGGTPETTFVVVNGGRLDMNQIGALVRPTALRPEPIELLAFSACESAKGDDRLELGLAGIALKSGARSVLATLWNVNDEAIAALMGDFYAQLAAHPDVTKAEALRRAQLRMLRNPLNRRFSSPHYWAPCVLVGNWL